MTGDPLMRAISVAFAVLIRLAALLALILFPVLLASFAELDASPERWHAYTRLIVGVYWGALALFIGIALIDLRKAPKA